jgi:hypothetical protein
MKKSIFSLLIIPLITICGMIEPGFSQSYKIPQSVFGNGGSPTLSLSNHINGTLGQPVIGIITGTSYKEFIGFWQSITYHVTGVNDETNLSSGFLIVQNYPNPFNSKTTISYTLPGDSYISLGIFNVLGEKVASLVDKTQQAGQYTVDWDASSFVSGTYFCRLEAGNNFQTSVLLLIK